MSRPDTQLVLASGSPRRRVLLEGAGLGISVRIPDIDERPHPDEEPIQFAKRMAEEKARAVPQHDGDGPILAGDTIVTIDGEILGKPGDHEDAQRMLEGLSGRTHEVVTGWAIAHQGQLISGTRAAEVTFRELTAVDIAAYIATGEPMDKAGAYGIQGHGGALVERYTGDFSTIVGFPLPDILSALAGMGLGSPDPIAQRLATVRGRLAAACHECGRSPDTVRIIGASKGQPKERLHAAYAAGLRDFGESYVQEWQEKQEVLPGPVKWHFIGHLQRNKVRFLVPGVDCIQTVSSERLALAIARQAEKTEQTVDCLIQINLGAEASKSGIAPDALPGLLEHLEAHSALRPVGLMAIPPNTGLAGAREWFRTLRQLRDSVATLERPLEELSMGMSGDFEAAVAEGATQIRIGTALFGPRPPRNT